MSVAAPVIITPLSNCPIAPVRSRGPFLIVVFLLLSIRIPTIIPVPILILILILGLLPSVVVLSTSILAVARSRGPISLAVLLVVAISIVPCCYIVVPVVRSSPSRSITLGSSASAMTSIVLED